MPAPMTPETLWRIQRVGAPEPAPDGTFAVVGVTTFDLEKNEGFERLWRVAPGADPQPLTAADVSSSQPALSRDGRRLAFVRKPHGAEHPQLYVMAMGGGEATRVGDFPLGARDPRWLPDGRRVVVVADVLRDAKTLGGTRALLEKRAKDPVKAHVTENVIVRLWDHWVTEGEVQHLFVVDVETGEARDLTPDSERWLDFMEDRGQYDVSPDGGEIVFTANATEPPYVRWRFGLFLVPVDGGGAGGGGVRALTPDHDADDARPRWTADGRAILFGRKMEADSDCDRVRLARLDRASGRVMVLTEAWDRSAVEWEVADARTVVLTAEDRGRTALFVARIDGDRAQPDRVALGGTIHGLRVAAGRAWAEVDSLRAPGEVVRFALDREQAPERVTRFNDDLMREVVLADIEETEFAGAGGEPCQLFVVRPPGFDPSRKWPLVHVIHGGPYGTFGDGWHFRWNAQAFAAAGYVLAMVNFHGSSSFGDSWSRSIRADWGGKPADDVLLATDALLARGFIDEKRMAITGGSYGGYMVAWLATRTDRFRCAVAHAAVYDLRSMWSSDLVAGMGRELGGQPWDGPDARRALDRNDPSAHAEGYRTPVLVVHGELDYRVPVTQGLELYGVLKAKGVPARLVHYPDENHWVLKPKNSLHWYGEFLGWLRKHLG
jgi:dipeptidyl aminopeptidase/acylaminoacyl peptidase